MADITPLVPEGRQVIQSYGGGGFRIAGTSHAGSVLVLPDRTRAWPVTAMAELTFETLAPVWETGAAVSVLLIGTGPRAAFLPAALRAALKDRGIVADVMATGAACRTFNVLLAEDRRVAAALMAVA
ncbi:MAG: hypothetical protein FJX67_00870 [Alphaproteobacteria bacterium]|nr:hypothetical protein [Alphaproteobacteria bacterium]